MKNVKKRKNLLLSSQAVECGERAARERNLSLSALVEKHLLSLSTSSGDDYWQEIIPLADKAGEARFEHLRQKHS